MFDVLGTTWVEVVGFERIAVSRSSAPSTSNEGSLKGTGLAARDVLDYVDWANLSSFHPSKSSLVSGAWPRSSYVLCAEISDTCDWF